MTEGPTGSNGIQCPGAVGTSSPFKRELWDETDYVITYLGSPIGQSLSRRDADMILSWLNSSWREMDKLDRDWVIKTEIALLKRQLSVAKATIAHVVHELKGGLAVCNEQQENK